MEVYQGVATKLCPRGGAFCGSWETQFKVPTNPMVGEVGLYISSCMSTCLVKPCSSLGSIPIVGQACGDLVLALQH